LLGIRYSALGCIHEINWTGDITAGTDGAAFFRDHNETFLPSITFDLGNPDIPLAEYNSPRIPGLFSDT
jgi:hypothetical protein